MPIASIVATLMAAALAMPGAGDEIGPQTAVAMRDMARSTPARAAGHQAEDAATTTRRINVAMEDNTFSPNAFDVSVGDTVTFVFTNFGKVVHDASIGDKAAQEHHEKEMRETPQGHDHAHAGGVTVHPGESGTLQYVFDKAGTLEIGCHQPGHYQDGMIAALNVKPA
jgi:uncharacterized cupredoxin-like copper-binding protein